MFSQNSQDGLYDKLPGLLCAGLTRLPDQLSACTFLQECLYMTKGQELVFLHKRRVRGAAALYAFCDLSQH